MNKRLIIIAGLSFPLAQATIILNELGCNHLEQVIAKQLEAIQAKGIPDENAIVAFMKQLQGSYSVYGGVAQWLKTDEGKELLSVTTSINDHVLNTQEYRDVLTKFRVMSNADILDQLKQTGYTMSAYYLQTKCLLKFPSLNNVIPSQDPFNFYYYNASIPDDQKVETYKYFCAGMMHNAYLTQCVQELKNAMLLKYSDK